MMAGVQEFRAKYRNAQFPLDLQKAYALGKHLVELAKEEGKNNP